MSQAPEPASTQPTQMPSEQEWKEYAKRDPILHGMIRDRLPLTRETWLRRAFLFEHEGVPDPVPPETEERTTWGSKWRHLSKKSLLIQPRHSVCADIGSGAGRECAA
jgi:hypothetical protein